MRILLLVLLVVSIASAYLGFYHLNGLNADAAKGAAVIGGILFLLVLLFGLKKA